MSDLLFVYGTLRAEFANPWAQRLRAEAEPRGPATTVGSIFLLGDYPGYRPEPPGEVRGELYHLTRPEETLGALDEYEGEEYARVLVRVNGGEEAWIYRYEGLPAPDSRIASGDFRAL